jgi:hypothetical protein
MALLVFEGRTAKAPIGRHYTVKKSLSSTGPSIGTQFKALEIYV